MGQSKKNALKDKINNRLNQGIAKEKRLLWLKILNFKIWLDDYHGWKH